MFDGTRIRLKREELGMSVKELAALMGTKISNVYKWEKNEVTPDTEYMTKLVKWISSDEYRDKYIALLERTNALLEATIKKLTQ